MSFSQKYGIEVPNLENVSIIEHLGICAPPRTSITITFGGEKLNNSCTFIIGNTGILEFKDIPTVYDGGEMYITEIKLANPAKPKNISNFVCLDYIK